MNCSITKAKEEKKATAWAYLQNACAVFFSFYWLERRLLHFSAAVISTETSNNIRKWKIMLRNIRRERFRNWRMITRNIFYAHMIALDRQQNRYIVTPMRENRSPYILIVCQQQTPKRNITPIYRWICGLAGSAQWWRADRYIFRTGMNCSITKIKEEKKTTAWAYLQNACAVFFSFYWIGRRLLHFPAAAQFPETISNIRKRKLCCVTFVEKDSEIEAWLPAYEFLNADMIPLYRQPNRYIVTPMRER